MKIQLIRHASLWLEYGGTTFLIDPMFSDQAVNPPIHNSADERRNPLVPLPDHIDKWLVPNAVLVTHLHPDHWDEAAAIALPKELPLFCQEGDRDSFISSGFTQITEVQASAACFQGITIQRTDGQHGTGEIGRKMGKVSGFVLQAEGEPTLYIAGDTIWCDDVKKALDTYKPDCTIVNAGGARFVVGDAITMDEEDVYQLVTYAPYTQVVAVHMDAINHCHVTREELRTSLNANQILDRVIIPEDGDWCEFARK
ncbi:MBL fold metallo-hydrolase [Paenibacillus xylaniclasticus]|uniref:MBL fold metallo-hydrolase n=1 Tax=Paenibacillus xylaniclasticus TaxID=588083 RepID=UPI000FDB1786|nr:MULTISPECIES: MBL fold metallo-hydrolase [Paenibacillus]GFN31397.1 MBL fold metallo-hydrolase [Paenibacillus curdlanolyticus]